MCSNSSMSTAVKFGYFPSLNYGSLIKTAGTAKQKKRNIKLVSEMSLKIDTFQWHPVQSASKCFNWVKINQTFIEKPS